MIPSGEKTINIIKPLTIVIVFFIVLGGIMLYTKIKEEAYIKEMKQRAQKHINILHDYYNTNGFMPSDYCADDETIIYIKESDTSFAVFFLLGFDESMTYHSNTKSWTIE